MSKVNLISAQGIIREFDKDHAERILAMENGGNWSLYNEPKKVDGNSGNKAVDKGKTEE
jgi:hypothetical protein